MSKSNWMIVEEQTQWRVVSLNKNDLNDQSFPIDEENTGKQIADFIFQNSGANAKVILALASHRCLASSLTDVPLAARRDRQTLVYSLEDSLPVMAENLVSDFVIIDESALGVAVESAPICQLVGELETRSIQVESISPFSLLALQGISRSLSLNDVDLIVWFESNRFEIFGLTAEKPIRWEVAMDSTDCLRRLQHWTIECEGRLRISGIRLPTELSSQISSFADYREEPCNEKSCHEICLSEGADIISGKTSAWIELRRDALAPRDPLSRIRQPLFFCAFSAFAFLLTIGIVFLFQANHEDQIAAQHQQSLEALFAEVFPESPVPVGVQSRLVSEHIKLSGIKGLNLKVPQITTLKTLRDIFSALPSEIRFRILDLRIEQEGSFFLEGEAKSHGDAERIAAAVRSSGLSVNSPFSQSLGGQGVMFRVEGSPSDETGVVSD